MQIKSLIISFALALACVISLAVAQDEEQVPAVVINEVAWSGTEASSRDEWIELYNNTAQTADLSGWTLSFGEVEISLSKVQSSTVEVRNSAIPANGFYLLERTDDDTVSNIAADLIYKGGLSNDGETLILRDSEGNIVDTANIDGGGWPAGTGGDEEPPYPPYASMERIDSRVADTDDNWGTNDGVTRNGLDTEGNPISGTPKQVNSTSKAE